MIYTVTFNPALDNYISLSDFEVGKTNYYDQGPKFYGGKAQNVSRILRKFITDFKLVSKTNAEITAISKGEFEENSHLFNDEFIRTNIKINDDGKITELNQQVNPLSIDSSKEIMKYLEEVITVDDIVVFSGKVSDEEIELIKDFRFNNPLVKLILDTSIFDQNLLQQLRPFMIKPNEEEIEIMFNTKINSIEDYINCGRELNKLGIEQVIISLGGEGSLCVTNDNIYKVSAAKGRVINTVGAGDSFVGGYLVGYNQGFTLEDTLKFASACGGATAFSEGIGKKYLIKELNKEITVELI